MSQGYEYLEGDDLTKRIEGNGLRMESFESSSWWMEEVLRKGLVKGIGERIQ